MKWFKQHWLHLWMHAGAILPMIVLVWDWFTGHLTVDPIQAATLRTGKTALILLMLSLACTPLNTLFGLRQFRPLRKWLGLYAFFYAAVHFLIFSGLDYGFNLKLLTGAIFEKRYAIAGFASGLILLALALTSTQGWKRRLGKWWKRLHRLVYLAGILAVVHYLWLVKSDIRQPLIFAGIVIFLLLPRLPPIRRSAIHFLRTKHMRSSSSSRPIE
jgi:sulfoxide reductase heme-binding subunit YedZ